MELEGSNFKLRPWKMSDKKSLAEQANNIKVWENVKDRFPHPYTIADAEEWIKDCIIQDPILNFAIEVDGKAAGSIGIELRTDVYQKNVELGYFLGEEYWNRGIMTQAIKEMAKYVFSKFDVVRIQASVYNTNPASVRVLEKAGFKLQGIFPGGIYKKGKYLDEKVFGLGKSD